MLLLQKIKLTLCGFVNQGVTQSTILDIIRIKKGQILQVKGDLNSRIYQVRSGLLRSYSIDHKGKEHIFMFAPQGWTIADYCPPTQPCELFIDAIEPSEALVLEKETEDVPDLDRIFRRMGILQQRIIMLMSATVAERYQHFIKTYPDIVQRVPQKMIASYLGITPERLSTVKRQHGRDPK